MLFLFIPLHHIYHGFIVFFPLTPSLECFRVRKGIVILEKIELERTYVVKPINIWKKYAARKAN